MPSRQLTQVKLTRETSNGYAVTYGWVKTDKRIKPGVQVKLDPREERMNQEQYAELRPE
jgi:hypothetical protein